MTKVRCLLNFKRKPINDRPVFASGVRDGIFSNAAVFAAPPIAEPVFSDLISTFIDKRGLYVNGGSAQEPAWNAANRALLNGLEEMADYVNEVADGDADIITLSGFEPTRAGRSESPEPTKPTGVSLKRDDDVPGRLIAECNYQQEASHFICILTEGAPLPDYVTVNTHGQLVFPREEPANEGVGGNAKIFINMIDINQSRRKVFDNLTSLQTYYVVYIATNATGVSPMSNTVSAVCV